MWHAAGMQNAHAALEKKALQTSNRSSSAFEMLFDALHASHLPCSSRPHKPTPWSSALIRLTVRVPSDDDTWDEVFPWAGPKNGKHTNKTDQY